MASQTKQGDLKMFTNKIVVKSKKNNSSLTSPESYDHYISLDWSERNMAIARMSKKETEPKVIDMPSDLKELKLYLTNLKGKKILTIEETTTSQWLFVELYDYADKIFICDPYRNRLLSDGPKTDKIDAKNALARYIAKISLGIIKSGEKYKPYKWRETKKGKEAA